MTDEIDPPAQFHRSTFCSTAGCVEVAAPSSDTFLIRDAKNGRPDAPVLRFTRIEWDAFLAGVAAGEFAPAALVR